MGNYNLINNMFCKIAAVCALATLANVARRRHETIKYFRAKHYKAVKAKWAHMWDMKFKKSVLAARKAHAHHKRAAAKHARAHRAMRNARKHWMHARHMRIMWSRRSAHAKRIVAKWSKAWRDAHHRFAVARHNLAKAVAHAKRAVKREHRARSVHHRAVVHHIRAKRAERRALHHRRVMHHLKMVALKHHRHATRAFHHAIAALRRSKKAAIAVHRAVVKHAKAGLHLV